MIERESETKLCEIAKEIELLLIIKGAMIEARMDNRIRTPDKAVELLREYGRCMK